MCIKIRKIISYKFSEAHTGAVRIYKYDGMTWTLLGSPLTGDNVNRYFGAEISLSNDGQVVTFDDGTTSNLNDNRGHVRVYQESGGNWLQIHQDINGESVDD